MTFKSKLTTAIATGAVLVNALAPMAFADTITVTGNGQDSVNHVTTNSNTTTTVNQTNTANITNHVDSSSSTGGNSSNGNTGGNVTVNTGSASSTSNVTNAANLNQANVSCSTCNSGSTDVTVTGNGEGSYNKPSVTTTNNVTLNQTNAATFVNDVNSSAKSGGNDATSNTGGNVTVTTGATAANTTVNNAANANVASLGGNGGNAGGTSVIISGNGEDSQNTVGLNQYSAVVLNQTNAANITNFVGAKAKSGGNSANGNTNGVVTISTGNATTGVTVNNAANFNAADLSCDCVVDGLTAKIGGNGEESWNTIYSNTHNTVSPTQGNGQSFTNVVSGHSKTGWNSANGNTGSVYGDPSVTTGAGNSTTNVNNAGNVNSIGNVGGVDFGTTFDLTGLMVFLNGLFA